MAKFRRGDIDSTYYALRPRLGNLGRATVQASTTIPPHTHSADQIGFSAAGNLAADDAQEALEELDSEKLARDGSQTMLGNLDMNTHDINNIVNADIEGNATVGVDIVMTGAIGSAIISDVRKISMTGVEANAEARIELVNAIVFNEVDPTPELARMAWDSTEDTLVVFVTSGA